MEFEAIIAELTAEIRRLSNLLEAKDAQIAALTEQVRKLTEQVADLTHKKNSNNSSAPPSTDRFEKPAPRSLHGKSGKPQGGQKGHLGKGMKIDREPDVVETHMPAQCMSCPNRTVCNHLKCAQTRYVYDVEIKTTLTAHKVIAGTCPMSGSRVEGAFPHGVTGTKQYGSGVFALVMSLLTVGYMSEDRIRQLLTSLNVPISTGTIQSMLSRASESAEVAESYIKDKITGQPVVNFDETGMRVAGSLYWLHCACNGPWRLYSMQECRGGEGMERMGVLPNFRGTAVHDFWSSYKRLMDATHAMCCQHLERELVFVEETGNQEWAGKLRNLLQGMCYAKNTLMAEGKEAFSKAELQAYMAKYDEIVAEGIQANPIPERKPGQRGRVKRGKIRSLLDRFQDCKDDILRFATDWKVPYTNNAAEQAIRFARIKEKVSGCFRTVKGAEQFARVLSFISTAVRHGISSFDACLSLHKGTALKMVQEF